MLFLAWEFSTQPTRLKVLGQAKINVRQMSRGDSFGCVIFKILSDNGAKTQPRQNTVPVYLHVNKKSDDEDGTSTGFYDS